MRLLIFVLCSIASPALAQQGFISIAGTVTEKDAQKPVPFANIHLLHGSAGTASNAVGEFIFKVPVISAGDTLIITSIGYKTSKRLIRNADADLRISLEPAPVELREITVKGESALELFHRVMAKVPENYDTSRYHMLAFYREDLGLGDFQLSHTEAVLDILKTFDTGKDKQADQLRIVKGRKKKIDFSSDFRLYIWISGLANGARSSLGEDMVKNRMAKWSPFNPENYKYYKFEYGETLQNGDRTLQVIDILPKKKSRRALFNIKIYVDETSLAIAKFEWDLTKEGVDRVERSDKNVGTAIMSVAIATTLDYDKFSVTVTYTPYRGKWYMNTVKRHLEILVTSHKRKMVDRVWHADAALQITDIDTQNKNLITAGDVGNTENSMNNLVGSDYDEAFWEHFNVVKPVIPDSLKKKIMAPDTGTRKRYDASRESTTISNRHNGFTRADTLRGKLTPLRSCYDVTFYHLDVAINLAERSLSGSNTIRFKAKSDFNVLQLDLYANMKIEKILYKNQSLQYTREFDAVFVRFPETLKDGTENEIKVVYEGTPKTPDWTIPMNGGVLWDTDSLKNTWAQMVCQGSGASLWWPNKDHLSDEPDSMKIWITVPDGFVDISNGRLQRTTSMPNEQTRYEWYVSYPINNYNVTFNIGKYVHYRDVYISNDTLTVDHYVMPYHLARARQGLAQAIPMLRCFEKDFGKYPFPRDGFTLVESLYPMEHQSGVCIGKLTPANSGEFNPLLWHESAHEWWGNSVGCTDLADMWFHEAFATYAEALIIESQFDKRTADQFLENQKLSIRNRDPIIGIYDVNNIYYDIEDMYSKGSLVLHTFRNVLNNDSLWFDLLRGIQARFRHQTITSNQLVSYINESTKTDYSYFFDQYVSHTALPQLEIVTKEEGPDLILWYRWHADVTDFHMPVKATTAPDQSDFIYPTTTWKTMTIKNMGEDEFEVDEGGFLIGVLNGEK